MTIRRILVPVDFSPRARHLLGHAFRFAAWARASVDVLHVVPGPGQAHTALEVYLGRPAPEVAPETVAAAQAELERLIASVAHDGVEVRAQVESGDAAAVIVRTAAQLPIDLVVIATRGHRGVSELFLGSTAHKVITCARCPVMTLRDDEG